MNIFEDLIEELKEENLLEETVIVTNKSSQTTADKIEKNAASFASRKNEVSINDFIEPDVIKVEVEESYAGVIEQNKFNAAPEISPEPMQNVNFDENAADITIDFDGVILDEPHTDSIARPETENLAKFVNQIEFFRNRATSEVLALQMVENVLAGVEREILNVAPKLYDELPVKKALHEFMQISAKLHSPEHAQAEFLLMQETESWYSALTHRDKIVKVGNLRLFCENSRPALSSQALVALARFYRNAPFSESVRSKFDLILTRLFSRDSSRGKRTLTRSRDELIEQISSLYAEWSSVPLYSTDEDDSEIVLAAMKLEDFMTEAENTNSFEELLKNDFFNRLRVFKESTQESFFAPLLAATVVESNVRIGNRYAELFEKENGDAETIEEKYGLLHEQTISEVICKTLTVNDLVSFSKVKTVKPPPMPPKTVIKEEETVKPEMPKAEIVFKPEAKQVNKLLRVNKWLLALTVVTLLVTLGLYIWISGLESISEENLSTNVKNVNLDNSSLKEHIQTARISGDIFYGVVMPSWDSLSREQKEQFISKVMLIGSEKGFLTVNLINKQGKTVGFAAPGKVEILNP